MGYYGLGPGSTVADKLSVLEQLLRKMPLETALEALDLLEKITRNVVQSPTDEKFRQVKITNAKLAPALNVPAALDIMREMGWELDGEQMVLPNSVKLDFQKHVSKIIDAKAHYKKALEQAKKAARINADPKKAEQLRLLELDRREREADRSSKTNFPSPLQPADPAPARPADEVRAPAPAPAPAPSAVSPGAIAGAPAEERQVAEQEQRSETAPEMAAPRARASGAFVAGDRAEVAILDGRYAGNWVSCQILGPGRTAGTYTIHVLPTTEFGRANGFSGTDLPDIEVEHLRLPGDAGHSRPGPCSFESMCIVS